MTSTSEMEEALRVGGFALLPRLVDNRTLEILQGETDQLLHGSRVRGGIRDALERSAALRSFAVGGAPAVLARELLGHTARPTKLTIFDKSGAANWKVPWHQDLTIAVQERHEVVGFGPWSVKDGVQHVQAPVSLLEQVLAIRVHLDETSKENGALRVLPGTHRMGRLPHRRIAELRQERGEAYCSVSAGGAMLMRPLLVHASSEARLPSRRRVLHFEYCAEHLPDPMSWAWPRAAPNNSLQRTEGSADASALGR